MRGKSKNKTISDFVTLSLYMNFKALPQDYNEVPYLVGPTNKEIEGLSATFVFEDQSEE